MRVESGAFVLAGRIGLVAVPVIVLSTACGASEPGTRSRSEATPAAVSTTMSTTVPVPSVTPAPAALPAAADPEACRNADCEVEVRQGDRLRLDAATGLDALTVAALDQGVVRLRFEGSSGGYRVEGMNVGVSQDCVNGRCRTRGALTLTMDRPARIGDIHLRLTSVRPDEVVLAISPS
ncbi:hypothetical protein [Microbispora amethystogenes]|uniref:Lipoprotein n=1 Tax=Microbispora amethystogenes TaxID=1427754 RepID=A0ABQ4F918_9ACTN|nr:hypothetical protein [Microbispora amethystogenes]GIH31268.1 hypothetical protein Mam01_14320 [Microbispora amethystogenes]